MAQINYEDLEDYLDSLDNNTPANPYDIEVVNILQTDLANLALVIKQKEKYISLTLDSSIIELEDNLFYQNAFIVNFTASCRYLKSNTFYNCENLESVKFLSLTVYVGSYTFYNCPNLKKARFYGYTALGQYCFANCTALSDLYVGQLSSTAFNNGSISITDANTLSGIASESHILNIYSSSDYSKSFYESLLQYPTLKTSIFGNGYNYVRIYTTSIAPKDIEIVNSYEKIRDVISVDYNDFQALLRYDLINNSCGIISSTKANPIKINLKNIPSSKFSPAKTGGENYPYNITYYNLVDGLVTEYDFTNAFGYYDFSETKIPTEVSKLDCSENSYIIKTPEILGNSINLNSAFKNCINLSCITNSPKNIQSSYEDVFTGCTSLYNLGVYKNLDNISFTSIFNSGKAIGYLGYSLPTGMFSALVTDLKIYTTSEYYEDLVTSVETNYPNQNFQVIQVDACLDYDELEDWLEAQPQNTAETPYKTFIGGGLSADKVKGRIGEYSPNITPSDLSNIIITCGKYVDLSCTQLPSDCTDLTAALSSAYNSYSYTYTYQNYITDFCEIPDSVTDIKYFAYYSKGLKTFGNNLIPSSVINAYFAFHTTKIENIFVEHKILSGSDYIQWTLDSNAKIYAKDYTYFKNNYSTLHNNRQIILECDYSDLDTYLGWFRNSCESVNLKVNGLVEANLIGSGTASPFTASALCSKLLGTNISDSTVKGYVAASTFDLSLTEIPSNQTSLLGCFQNGNVSYSFAIPNTVTNMKGTFADCPLVVAPTLPSNLVYLVSTFAGTDITEAPAIPSTVTNMEGAFFETHITIMPDIPNGVTSLVKTFQGTDIVNTKQIPATVTDMTECFSWNYSLKEVTNIPSSVTDLTQCFEYCSSLETINGWGVDTNNATMTSCFSGCTSLTEINTTTKKTVDYDKWVHITVKTDTTDNTKYNLTLRTLATETQQAQTLTIQVDKAVIYSYLTDEILFSPNGTLSDSYITDMLNYKYPFGGGLDPANKNFVLWAAQGSAVKQNLSSQSGFTGSDINVSNNNTTKIASIIGNETGLISQNYVPNTQVPTIQNAGNAGAVCTTSENTNAKAIDITNFNFYNGATIKVCFTKGNKIDNPMLSIGGSSGGYIPIVFQSEGKLYRPKVHTGYWRGSSTTSSEMWQPYITLELMYLEGTQEVYADRSASTATQVTGGVWLIVGNPVVESYYTANKGYSVYTDGKIEQWLKNDSPDNTQTGKTLILPIKYSNTNYCVTAQAIVTSVHWSANTITPQIKIIDNNSFTYWNNINHVSDEIITVGY